MDINIETKVYDDGTIEVIMDRTARLVVNTTEEYIKQALKTLGWLSPQDAETLRAENAKLKMLHDAEITLADMLKSRVNEFEAERGELNKVLSSGSAIVKDGILFNIHEKLFAAEDHESCMLAMDDAGFPRHNESGAVYSLWGRVKAEREAMMKQDPLSTRASLIEEALFEYFGRKCPDYDAACKCCQAWGQFEALQAKQIPEGYALVPVEPTEEALKGMHMAYCNNLTGHECSKPLWVRIYKAMLSASQPKGDV